MAEISESSSRNTKASIGQSEHGGVLPPLESGIDIGGSLLRKMNVDDEKLAGRKRYRTDLDQYESNRDEYYVISEGSIIKFARNIALKLIMSAVHNLGQVAEGLVDDYMVWQIDLVLGGHRHVVRGYPGGGLMVLVGYRTALPDLTEDELAVAFASAIIDIMNSQNKPEKYMHARATDGWKRIAHTARFYLSKLGSFTAARERVFSKDRMIVRILEGAGYDRQIIFDWLRADQPPHFYTFTQPSQESRARKLRAWIAKDKMPIISQVKRQTARLPKWYPNEKRIDILSTKAEEILKRTIKGTNTKAVDIKGTNTKAVDIKGTNTKAVDIKGTNTKAVDIKGTNTKAVDIKGTNTKAVDIKGTNTKAVDIKGTNTKAVDNKET